VEQDHRGVKRVTVHARIQIVYGRRDTLVGIELMHMIENASWSSRKSEASRGELFSLAA
jgi:hypothetical protein